MLRQSLGALLLASLAVVGHPAIARDHYHQVSSPDTSSDYYTNVAGHRVHRPVAANTRPAGATARCRDESWSFSENHRGTCSHHGGVASWL